MQNATLLYSMIALVGGVAVPVLAAINAAYGQALGSVHFAALTLCIVAFLSISLVALATASPIPSVNGLSGIRWWHFAGGCFFAIYIVSITYVAPKIGIGNAIMLVVVAQILTAVTIDHFGFFETRIIPLDWKRLLGICLLILGMALARSAPTSPGSG